MALIKVQGIVLKQINIGESDKIITIFTDKLGKIQAVAHGSRKTKSKLMSSTQTFSYCEYVLYKGRSLYTISQAEIKESFQFILDDLYTLTYCSYITELVDALTQDNEINIELFLLILKTFYLMTDEAIDKEILLRTFELKSMSISGYMPNVSTCSICRAKDRKIAIFSIENGGVICEECARNGNHGISISPSTLTIIRFMLKTNIEKIKTLKVSDSAKDELKVIMKNYIKYYLEKDFKSLEFLDDLRQTENKGK